MLRRCPGPLPPPVELTTYRIVQEALTNILKHGGPTGSRSLIDHSPDEIFVEVLDDGRPARSPAPATAQATSVTA